MEFPAFVAVPPHPRQVTFHFCLPQATTEPLSPLWNTRYAPIPTCLVLFPEFSAQGQGNRRLACLPLFPSLALTP